MCFSRVSTQLLAKVLEDDGGEWLEVGECAKRMGCTPERMLDLVRRRALRTRHLCGATVVRPAIVTGGVRTDQLFE